MSLPPQQPAQAPKPPDPPIPQLSQAQIEYDRLTGYFEKLVKYTYGAILLVLAAAGVFLWRSTDDVKTQATAAIKTIQEKTKSEAQDVAKSEAQNAIDRAFEKENIEKMIEAAAQKKVGVALDEEVQRKLRERIDSVRVLTTKIAQVTNHSAMVLQGNRAGLDELRKDQEDSDSTVRAFATSTLKQLGANYERELTLTTPMDNTFQFFPSYRLRDLMGKIRQFQGAHAPEEIAKAFLDMKRRVQSDGLQWDVPTFDIAAAEKWCAVHKPKCDE